MKKICPAIALATLVLIGPAAHALDREASMIDTIGLLGTPFDDAGMLAVTLWGETALPQETDWAFLLGGQYGSVSPHRITDIDEYWSVGIGIKWYMMPLTAISVTGEYGQYEDIHGSPSARTGTVSLKQRLRPADAPLSPFFTTSIGLRSSDDVVDLEGRDFEIYEGESAELLISFGGGCDVAMTEDMAIALEAAWIEGEDIEDGWMASVGMKYYWE